MSSIRHYTIIEVIVAALIMVLLLGSILPFAIGLSKSKTIDSAKSALRQEFRLAQERLTKDLYGTVDSLVEVALDVDGVPYGIAMPVRVDETKTLNETGNADANPTMEVLFKGVAVYYLDGTPSAESPCRLWRAEVAYGNAEDYQTVRKEIIPDLLAGMSGDYNVISEPKVILENVTEAEITPGDSPIDCYASEEGVRTVNLGTTRLEAGKDHTIRFTVTDRRNESAPSYTIGLDRFQASLSGRGLEAERLIATASGGTITTPAEEPPPGEKWFNNRLLNFSSASKDASFTLQYFNETWMDTDFIGGKHDETRVTQDASLTTKDLYLEMAGDYGVSPEDNQPGLPTWKADEQAGSTMQNYSGTPLIPLRTVRVLIPGDNSGLQNVMQRSGAHPRVTLASSVVSSDSNLWLDIDNPTIMECDSAFNGVPGTVHALTFNGGKIGIDIRKTKTSDPVNGMEFDVKKSYLVSFEITSCSSNSAPPYKHANPGVWGTPGGTVAFSMVVSGQHAADVDFSSLASEPDSWTTSQILGVQNVRVSYPLEAEYLSDILDTKVVDPTFKTAVVEAVTSEIPADSTYKIQFRASDNEEGLVDALWKDSIADSGLRKRFFQYRVVFNTTKALATSPRVRAVTVTWEHDTTKNIQCSARVKVGPDQGKFKCEIDGGTPIRPFYRLSFEGTKECMGKQYKDRFTIDASPRIQ